MKNLLNITLSLSLALMSSLIYAQASKSYQAAIVADCSKLEKCPLVKGDTLLTSNTSRSGLPLRNAILILGLNTQVKIANLNTQLKEFNLIKGTINLNVLENQPRHVYQINAGKLLKIFIREAGYYKINVSENQKETVIQVIKGRAEIRIGKIVRAITQGQTANIKETNNRSPIYTNVQRPMYDNDYNFSMNFIHNYYTLYPIGAPSARLIPRYITNGPKVEIFYARPLTFYNQPTVLYREPIIIRDSRYRNVQPLISIDVNLNKVFGTKSQHRTRSIADSNSIPVSRPDPDSTARPEIIPDANPNNPDNIDYNAIPTPSPHNKAITGTTSVVTPEAIPDATPEEMNAKPDTNDQVSGTTTDLTPGATSQESFKKVIKKPSEEVLSRPVTQPQIDRHPGVRSEALVPQDTRPQPTREVGIRRDPPINSDAQTSKKVIPDADPEDPRNTPHLIQDTNQEFENNGN